MKTSYRREMRRNYMIIDPEKADWSECEERMLSGNTIDGVLKLRVRQTEDGVRFYYDITSRQPLSRMFRGMRWKTEQILALLQGIFSAMERLEGYLVKESDIYLDPDFVYLSPESFRVWLCVVPGLGFDFREQFGKLLEKLLEHVDHEDKPSVILAYGIYQATRREDYGTEDIRRAVSEERKKAQDAQREEQTFREAEETPDVGCLADFPASCPEKMPEAGPEEKPHSFLGAIAERLGHFRSRDKKAAEDAKKGMRKALPGLESCGVLQTDFRETGASEQQNREEEEAETGAHAERAEAPPAEPLYVLRGKDWGTEDIPLLYYPFVIGKQSNLVDYRLEDETISRLHARIDRKGGGFVIQDLNSTNGTMVNNRLLENNEEAEIHPGDEIGLARYRFIIERKT